MRTSILIAIVLLLGLSGCGGFQPLYAKHSGGANGQELLHSVHLKPAHDRVGQILYTALYPHFKRGSVTEKKYILKIAEPKIRRLDTSLAPDGTYLLDQVSVRAKFILFRSGSGDLIEEFGLRNTATYNVSNADAYSSESAFQQTQRHLLYDIAEQLRARIVAILANLEA